MKSLRTLYRERERALSTLNHCLEEFGEPNGWNTVLARIDTEITAAKVVSEVPELYKDVSVNSLVSAIHGIRKTDLDGRAAELELHRRLKEVEFTKVDGPATVIFLENGMFNIDHLPPGSFRVGRFLAYNVGIYD